MPKKRHELFNFMQSVASEMKLEYERISLRTKEDPGTAGDEGEENWATFFRNWLPATYPIVTKGRILGSDGAASPQVDLIILNPNYPKHLRNKKLYFAGGVLAAFECKINLKKRHIKDIWETARFIKNIEDRKPETLFQEYNSRIIYGVLAHTHSLKGALKEDQVFKIMECLIPDDNTINLQPFELADIYCISDTASYILNKRLIMRSHLEANDEEILDEFNSDVMLNVGYNAHWVDEGDEFQMNGTIHGTLVASLMRKLAYFDHSIRDLTKYIIETEIEGASIGRVCQIPLDEDEKLIAKNYENSGSDENIWNEWGRNL